MTPSLPTTLRTPSPSNAERSRGKDSCGNKRSRLNLRNSGNERRRKRNAWRGKGRTSKTLTSKATTTCDRRSSRQKNQQQQRAIMMRKRRAKKRKSPRTRAVSLSSSKSGQRRHRSKVHTSIPEGTTPRDLTRKWLNRFACNQLRSMTALQRTKSLRIRQKSREKAVT